MSMTPVKGQEPKRRRGHLRVAAIMETGMALFVEKGFDATTMTEIAQRSGTATASLYRFFPSKEALAEALMERSRDALTETFADLRDRVAGMTAADLAEELVSVVQAVGAQRRLAGSLSDALALSDEKRNQFRAAFADGLATVVRTANPALSRTTAGMMGTMLLALFKGVLKVSADWEADDGAVRAELTALVRLYLEARYADATASAAAVRP